MRKIVVIFISMFLLSVIFGYFFFTTPRSVDVDCLLDIMEDANMTELSQKYGKGVIGTTWTLGQVEDFYWSKHPKTRWTTKAVLNYYIMRCEK